MTDTNSILVEAPTSKFLFPYSESEPMKQLVLNVSVADHGLIKCNRPDQGTLRIVGALLWKKLSDLCRAKGIVDMHKQSEFENLVVDLVLVSKEEHEHLISESAQLRQLRAAGSVISEPTKRTPKPKLTKNPNEVV